MLLFFVQMVEAETQQWVSNNPLALDGIVTDLAKSEYSMVQTRQGPIDICQQANQMVITRLGREDSSVWPAACSARHERKRALVAVRAGSCSSGLQARSFILRLQYFERGARGMAEAASRGVDQADFPFDR